MWYEYLYVPNTDLQNQVTLNTVCFARGFVGQEFGQSRAVLAGAALNPGLTGMALLGWFLHLYSSLLGQDALPGLSPGLAGHFSFSTRSPHIVCLGFFTVWQSEYSQTQCLWAAFSDQDPEKAEW